MREMRQSRSADGPPQGRVRTARQSCRGALALAALAITPIFLTSASLAGAEGTAPSLQLAQTSKPDGLRITVAPSISARSASQAPLQIRIAPTDALPKNCFVRVRGLPPAVSLSEGYTTAPGAWAVPLYALANLQMVVPAGVSGRAELSISLVGEDGALLADAKSALVVELPLQAPQSAPAGSRTEVQPPLSPTPRPRGPILSPADRETAERFVARGEREIEQGQIAVARNFFLRAAQLGLARGALLLAATYDPRELARWRAHGVQPNFDEARKWYEKARELGAPEAEERLARLGAG